jgi:hypothetical protein
LPLLLVAPGFLAVVVFLALAFFQTEPKDVALVTAAALAASPVFQKLKGKMDTPALTRVEDKAIGPPNAERLRKKVEVRGK